MRTSRLQALRAGLRAELADGWQEEAACAEIDPEAWFPVIGAPAVPQVLAVCAGCPVRRSCLASALLGKEYGVWAGTTRIDRSHLYRRLRAGQPVADVLDAALHAAATRPAEVLGDVA